MFKLKREGTGTLCDTCRFSQIMRGHGKEIIYCRKLERKVPFPILDCSRYEDCRKMSSYEMDSLAWILITEAKHGAKVGFYSPKERQKHEIGEEETPGLYR